MIIKPIMSRPIMGPPNTGATIEIRRRLCLHRQITTRIDFARAVSKKIYIAGQITKKFSTSSSINKKIYLERSVTKKHNFTATLRTDC